jgi:hypothetical protein
LQKLYHPRICRRHNKLKRRSSQGAPSLYLPDSASLQTQMCAWFRNSNCVWSGFMFLSDPSRWNILWKAELLWAGNPCLHAWDLAAKQLGLMTSITYFHQYMEQQTTSTDMSP